jgi:hypothetical protein
MINDGNRIPTVTPRPSARGSAADIYNSKYDGGKTVETEEEPEQDSRPYATIPVTVIEPPTYHDCEEPEASTTAETQQSRNESVDFSSTSWVRRPRSFEEHLDKNKLWLIQAKKSPLCPIDIAARLAVTHKNPYNMTEFDQRKRCASWEIEFIPGAAPPPQVRCTDPPNSTPDENFMPQTDNDDIEAISTSRRAHRDMPHDFPPACFRETERMAIALPHNKDPTNRPDDPPVRHTLHFVSRFPRRGSRDIRQSAENTEEGDHKDNGEVTSRTHTLATHTFQICRTTDLTDAAFATTWHKRFASTAAIPSATPT